jgi:hypothetical protein
VKSKAADFSPAEAGAAYPRQKGFKPMSEFVYDFEEQIEVNGVRLDAYFSGGATVGTDYGRPIITAIYLDGTKPSVLGRIYSRRRVKEWLPRPAGEPATFYETVYAGLLAALEDSPDLREAWAAHVESERADAA